MLVRLRRRLPVVCVDQLFHVLVGAAASGVFLFMCFVHLQPGGKCESIVIRFIIANVEVGFPFAATQVLNHIMSHLCL